MDRGILGLLEFQSLPRDSLLSNFPPLAPLFLFLLSFQSLPRDSLLSNVVRGVGLCPSTDQFQSLPRDSLLSNMNGSGTTSQRLLRFQSLPRDSLLSNVDAGLGAVLVSVVSIPPSGFSPFKQLAAPQRPPHRGGVSIPPSGFSPFKLRSRRPDSPLPGRFQSLPRDSLLSNIPTSCG